VVVLSEFRWTVGSRKRIAGWQGRSRCPNSECRICEGYDRKAQPTPGFSQVPYSIHCMAYKPRFCRPLLCRNSVTFFRTVRRTLTNRVVFVGTVEEIQARATIIESISFIDLRRGSECKRLRHESCIRGNLNRP
jgi:hypothetical protein